MNEPTSDAPDFCTTGQAPHPDAPGELRSASGCGHHAQYRRIMYPSSVEVSYIRHLIAAHYR